VFQKFEIYDHEMRHRCRKCMATPVSKFHWHGSYNWQCSYWQCSYWPL